MTKDYRKEIRFDENIKMYLDRKENISDYIRSLILKDMSKQTSLLLEKNMLQQEEQKLKGQLVDIQLQIQYVDEEIEELERRSKYRCDGYDEAIDILNNLPFISIGDVEYQAKRLNVDVPLFKQWLFDDGFFDEHIH